MVIGSVSAARNAAQRLKYIIQIIPFNVMVMLSVQCGCFYSSIVFDFL
jgi:hypothetical protein